MKKRERRSGGEERKEKRRGGKKGEAEGRESRGWEESMRSIVLEIYFIRFFSCLFIYYSF